MRRRALVALALVAMASLAVWRGNLFTVQAPGARPEPLALAPEAERPASDFEATLAAVPAGSEHLRPGEGVLLLHYWAPWERNSGPQARGLDSLRRILPPGSVRVAVVCFDPYPSVARYIARMRLRLPVLLDQRRELAGHLPCPSIPYTYVLDRSGRIAVSQAGEVDWLSPATRQALDRLVEEPAHVRPAPAERRSAS